MIFGRQFAFGMDLPRIAIEIGRQKLELAVLPAKHEHSVVLGTELGIGRIPRDQFRYAAARADAVNPGILRKLWRGQIASRTFFENDRAAIRRKAGLRIVALHAGDHARIGSIGIGGHDLPEARIGPAHICEPPPVAGP